MIPRTHNCSIWRDEAAFDSVVSYFAWYLAVSPYFPWFRSIRWFVGSIRLRFWSSLHPLPLKRGAARLGCTCPIRASLPDVGVHLSPSLFLIASAPCALVRCRLLCQFVALGHTSSIGALLRGFLGGTGSKPVGVNRVIPTPPLRRAGMFISGGGFHGRARHRESAGTATDPRPGGHERQARA